MKILFTKDHETIEASLDKEGKHFKASWGEQLVEGHLLEWNPPHFTVQTKEGLIKGSFFRNQEKVDLHLPSGTFRLSLSSPKTRRSASGPHEGDLKAPMPGKVVKILVRKGDSVKKGDLLMILEAMKMEHKIVSPKDGTIKVIRFQEGDRVAQEQDVIELE